LYVPDSVFRSLEPSRMNMLLRLRAPLTAGKLNCPTDAPFHPPPPPLFWSVLMFATPGMIVNNSVKLRPFRGRSFICCADTQLKVEGSSLANLEGYRRL